MYECCESVRMLAWGAGIIVGLGMAFILCLIANKASSVGAW